MRAWTSFLILFLGGLTCLAKAEPAKGSFKLKISSAKPENQAAEKLIRGTKEMETLVKEMNENFILSKDVLIEFKESEEGPQYQDGTILVNYDFVQENLDGFKKDAKEKKGKDKGAGVSVSEDPTPEQLTLFSVEFILFHELGHSLIDLYSLPVLGKEEDAVDSLAAIISLEIKGNGDIALAGADAFALWAQNRQEYDDSDFWDEHSLDEQRFFSTVCLLYGSGYEAYADLLKEAGMPKEREEFCQAEYQQKLQSWQAVLKPHLTDHEVLQQSEEDEAGEPDAEQTPAPEPSSSLSGAATPKEAGSSWKPEN